MSFSVEIANSLRSMVRVLRFDPNGPKSFSNTPFAVWVSLAVAGLATALPVMTVTEVMVPMRPALLLLSVIELLLWPTFMTEISRRIGRGGYFCRYISAYNWLVVLKAVAAFAVVTLPVALLQSVAVLLVPVAVILMIVYEGFLARHGLDLPLRSAVAIVVFNWLVRWGLSLAGTMFILNRV